MRIYQHMFVLIVLSCIYSKVYADYEIGKLSSWNQTATSCSNGTAVAIPRIKYNQTGPFVDVSLMQFDNTSIGESVWVGYIQTYKVFQYIGCVKLEDAKKADPSTWAIKHYISADLGQCFSICKSTIFGIVRTVDAISGNAVCYCFNKTLYTKLPADQEVHCNTKCYKPKLTACGGNQDGPLYVSLYQHVKVYHVNNQKPQDKSCLSLSNKDFKLRDCQDELPRMCQKTHQPDSKTQQWLHNTTWLGGINTSCFNFESYPLSYTKGRIGGLIESWTGMLRSLVTYPYKEVRLNQHVTRGYISRTGNGVHTLLFTNATDKTKRIALCEHTGKADPSSTTSTDETTEKNTDAEDIDKEHYESEFDKTKGNDDSPGLTIGVCVGVGVFVIVVVIVAVFLFRRHRLRKTKRQNANNEDVNGEVCYDTATYELGDKSKTTNGQQYNPVNTHGQENTYDSASNDNCDLSEGIYNHTDTHSRKQKITSDDTYNHINVVSQRSVKDEDQTYDTTETSERGNNQTKSGTARDTENVYNTLDNGEDSTYNSAALQRHDNRNGNENDYDSCGDVIGTTYK